MSEFKTWNELTLLEQYACQYWDMYKDAYGFRPRGVDTSSWTAEQFEEEFKILGSIIDEEYEREQQEAMKSVADYKSMLTEVLSLGAKDEEMALRWLVSDEKFYSSQDVEHYVWKQGILFTDYGRELVKKLENIVTFEEYAA